MRDAKMKPIEAKSLMNNEAFVEAMEKAREVLIAQAMKCDPRDDLMRFRYLQSAKDIDALKAFLNAVIVDDGSDAPNPENYYTDKQKPRLARIFGKSV